MGLTTTGWIFFLGGWGAIIGLAVYCFGRVLAIESKKTKEAASRPPGQDA
jgi:hypothetical protein